MRRKRWVISGGAVATLLAVAAVVAIVGATLLALRGSDAAQRKATVDVTVFIRGGAIAEEMSSLEAKIKSAPGVERYDFLTKQETLTRLADGRPEVMLPAYTGAASYVVRLEKGVDVRASAQRFFLEPAVGGIWVPGLGLLPARTGVKGRVLTVGGPSPGLPQPYPASEITVVDSAGRLVAVKPPNDRGSFRIKLLPGDYTVKARPTSGNPMFESQQVRVSGGYTRVDLHAQIR
jgi:hypothetical protein